MTSPLSKIFATWIFSDNSRWTDSQSQLPTTDAVSYRLNIVLVFRHTNVLGPVRQTSHWVSFRTLVPLRQKHHSQSLLTLKEVLALKIKTSTSWTLVTTDWRSWQCFKKMQLHLTRRFTSTEHKRCLWTVEWLNRKCWTLVCVDGLLDSTYESFTDWGETEVGNSSSLVIVAT